MLATIHVDLDGSQHIFQARGWRYGGIDDRLFTSGIQNALNFFEQNEIQATFFVIAQDLGTSWKREHIQEVVDRGHEIASHSYTHRKLSTLNHDEKRYEIIDSKRRLISVLGVDIHGFRAPELDFDREVLELVGSAGYTYDSSFFPSARTAKRIGISETSIFPHQLFDHHPLMELPLPIYHPLPLPFHPSYSLVLGRAYFAIGLRRFRRTGAPLVLLFHLTDFSEPLPKDQLPGWQSQLFTLSHLSKAYKLRQCATILRQVRRHYQIVTTSELVSRYSQVAESPGILDASV